VKPRVLIGFGLVLLGLAALWRFGLSSHWTARITPGWQWEANYVGIETSPDPTTGKFPEKDGTGAYKRTMVIVPKTTRSSAVLLEDHYVVVDPATDKTLWEVTFRAPVDPETGAHLEEKYHQDYFVFPRGVEKKSYNLRFAYLKGIPLSFQKEEEIEGIATYLFAYKGRGEYTESYAGTLDYPGIRVEPGQEIKCADDQFTLKLWVEPITGEILKTDESCYSGDYVFEIATGKALYPVMRWSGITAGDDVIRRAAEIRAARAEYLWAAFYIPCILSLAGLVALGIGGLRLKFRRI